MKKLDCFAIKNNNCVALTKSNCDDCTFYCPADEMARRRAAIAARLRSLSTVTQEYVAGKYYGGKAYWHEEAMV